MGEPTNPPEGQAPTPAAPAGGGEDGREKRLDALEAKVDAILNRLSGSGQGGQGEAAGDIAEQVRRGVEQIEAEKAKKAADEQAQKRQEELAARLQRLEQPPAEDGSLRARLARRMYGTNPDGSAVQRAARQVTGQ
jgi:hypothetical protein